jgi:hypothetical protein
MALALCFLSLTSNVHAGEWASQSLKAAIVDRHGNTLGYRGVRDLSQCGKDIGPMVLSEEPAANSERMYLSCSQASSKIVEGAWAGSEVRTLVSQGPVQNRIDLAIVADGYTELEKQKFFDDALAISEDLFTRETFASYRALFNVHAVFVPSVESGIGDGRPKNTALKLYRDSTYRQAVMPGDPGAAARASRLAPDVDYPILLGNDAFYGGLGGQFAITTASPLNLTTVLRHELGHNFGRVGEEYDGGQVYSGANFSRSSNLPWKHWIKSSPLPIYKMNLLHYSAPWKNLTNSDLVQNFQVNTASQILIDFSSLGFDKKDDVALFVDERPIDFEGEFNYDRNFYLVYVDVPAGNHTVRFQRKATDTNNIVSKLAIYSVPTDYPKEKDLVGGFSTYQQGSTFVGYRPTDRTCLMKDMHSHKFCSVCVENMWSFFLKEVNLVDGIKVSDVDGSKRVEVSLIPFGDRLQVDWIDGQGKIRTELRGLTTWQSKPQDSGLWKVRVSFVSSEVKAPGHEAWSIHETSFRL